MRAVSPLAVSLPACEIEDAESFNQFAVLQNLKIEKILNALDKMHKKVNDTLWRLVLKLSSVNAKTYIRPYNSMVVDYVIVARSRGSQIKMFATWVGPRRIVQVRSHSTAYVKHLLVWETSILHFRHINPYADQLIGTKVAMKELDEVDDRLWFSLDKIEDIREVKNGFETFVSWKG